MSTEVVMRPDPNLRDSNVAPLDAQLKKIDAELQVLKKRINAKPKVASDEDQERKTVQTAIAKIIKEQSSIRGKRVELQNTIKGLEASTKRMTLEVSNRLGNKNGSATMEEVKLKIDEISRQLASKELTLVGERELQLEKNSLLKLRTVLVFVEPIKKSIGNEEVKITALKDQFSKLNLRDVTGRLETEMKKLSEIQNKAAIGINRRQALFIKRALLYKQRDQVYNDIRTIRNDFDKEFRAYVKKNDEEALEREQANKLRQLLKEKEEKLAILQIKLSEASLPAYATEISNIQSCLLALDPTYDMPTKKVFEINDSTLNVQNNVKVRIPVQNDDLEPAESVYQEEHHSTAPSKSRKFKKIEESSSTESLTPESNKFTLDPTLISSLAELDVTVPINIQQVKRSIMELKTKLEKYTSGQDNVTLKNISIVEVQIQKVIDEYAQREEDIKKIVTQTKNSTRSKSKRTARVVNKEI